LALAENLRRLRLERAQSQAEFARDIGVTRQTIVRLESGKGVSYATLRLLADKLNMRPAELAAPEDIGREKAAA
jgi:transcriptional regulator with XRE-family HTH domain